MHPKHITEWHLLPLGHVWLVATALQRNSERGYILTHTAGVSQISKTRHPTITLTSPPRSFYSQILVTSRVIFSICVLYASSMFSSHFRDCQLRALSLDLIYRPDLFRPCSTPETSFPTCQNQEILCKNLGFCLLLKNQILGQWPWIPTWNKWLALVSGWLL